MEFKFSWSLFSLLAVTLPQIVGADSIAIIGAGIAGSSAAWFLRGSGLDVTVFEREPTRVGGRVREVEFPQQDPLMVETGGAAIHSLNKYMASFIDLLGLHRDTSLTGSNLVGPVSSMGVATFDGRHLIPFSPMAYPLSLVKARQMVSKVVSLWEHVYDLQARNVSFSHPRTMLQAVGVADLAAMEARAWMRHLNSRFLREFVDGVSRVNYGQDASINAFADAVSLAGAGLVGSLFSVREGNAKVVEGLLLRSGANLIHERVTAVRSQSSGYSVCTSGGCSSFNSVIIAAPLELADLILDLGPSAKPRYPSRPYQTTIATFIAASGLNPSFFGRSDAIAEDSVMTISNASIAFNSVAVHGTSAHKKIYKLFSVSQPSAGLLSQMFLNASEEVRQFTWQAYPVLRPSDPESWPAFRLHSWRQSRSGGGVYYVNAMESPVSCMETEVVAAKNVALLALEDVRHRSNGVQEQGLEPALMDFEISV